MWGRKKKEGRARVGLFASLRPATATTQLAPERLARWELLRGPGPDVKQHPEQAREARLWSQQQPSLGWQGWAGLGRARLRGNREFFASRLINAYIGQGFVFPWAVTRSLSKFASLARTVSPST